MLPHSYFDSVATYWALRLLLLAVLVGCGWGISYRNKNNANFWNYAWLIIVVYSLTEGLRYGRGRDYMQYASEMVSMVADRESLYGAFVALVRWLKIPYWLVFIFYSYLLIYGFLKLLEHFPRYAVWALPAFFLLTDYPAECLIRQFLAIAFYFMGMAAYYSGKRRAMWIYMICVVLIHATGALGVVVFLIMVYWKPDTKVPSVWWLLGPYIAVVMLFDVNSLTALADLLKTFNIGGRFQHYLTDADRWFTTEGSITGLFGKKADLRFAYSRLFYNGVIMYYGWRLVKAYPAMRIPYWFAALGSFFIAFGGDIELYTRFGWWFNIMMPLVFAGIMAEEEEFRLEERLFVFAVFAFTYVLQFIFTIGKPGFDGSAFVWDTYW